MDGEKDPRNLMTCFSLMRVITANLAIDVQAEVGFVCVQMVIYDTRCSNKRL